MTDLIHAWERIEAWLREHRCTSALSSLHPPASEEALQSLQGAIAYPLHPDLVQWLRIHGAYGNVIEIDYEGNEVTAVRWRSLGEMIRLMAESLESGLPMPYSHQYARAPRLDEGPPRSLDWRLEKTHSQVWRSARSHEFTGKGAVCFNGSQYTCAVVSVKKIYVDTTKAD